MNEIVLRSSYLTPNSGHNMMTFHQHTFHWVKSVFSDSWLKFKILRYSYSSVWSKVLFSTALIIRPPSYLLNYKHIHLNLMNSYRLFFNIKHKYIQIKYFFKNKQTASCCVLIMLHATGRQLLSVQAFSFRDNQP